MDRKQDKLLLKWFKFILSALNILTNCYVILHRSLSNIFMLILRMSKMPGGIMNITTKTVWLCLVCCHERIYG